MREPIQVLAVMYTYRNNEPLFYVFKRRKARYWQFIAGGKEDFDEDLITTVQREIREETGVCVSKENIISLDTVTSVPADRFQAFIGSNQILVIEKCFAMFVPCDSVIKLSKEHSKYKLVDHRKANQLLKWDSNRVALYEVCKKIVENI